MQLFKKNFFGEKSCPNSPFIGRKLINIEPNSPSSPDSFFEETHFLDQEFFNPLGQSVIGKPGSELKVLEHETLLSDEHESSKCVSVIISEISESYNNLEKDKASVQNTLKYVRKMVKNGLGCENAIIPLENQVKHIDNLLIKFFEQLHLLNNELQASSKITN